MIGRDKMNEATIAENFLRLAKELGLEAAGLSHHGGNVGKTRQTQVEPLAAIG